MLLGESIVLLKLIKQVITENLFNMIIIIAVISVLWAVLSLKTLGKDKKTENNVKTELKKGRVVFQKEN